VNLLEDAPEIRHSLLGFGGEVCTTVEGFQVRCQKDAHWPSPTTGHGLHGLHVYFVQVGTFLSVDLDVHVEVVHNLGGLRILEGLPLHHVTPVTGGIPDAEENRFALLFRLLESFLAPGIPVHRIVGVLQKVGTRFVDQSILLVTRHEKPHFQE
jgi:hypothetical protein